MIRRYIFDAVRAMLGRSFTTAEIAQLDFAIEQALRGQMRSDFDRALDVILHHEGGFANHPRDPGGVTMLGVTKRVWEQWTGKPASVADMKALTPEIVAPLYRKNYWEAVRGDELPPRLALCVFDFAVNAGPGRAFRTLQSPIGAEEDRIPGPATLQAVKDYVAEVGEEHAVRAYQDARRAFYRSLGTFPTFGKGWLRRVDEVEAKALNP